MFGGVEGKEKFVLNRLCGPRLVVCPGAGAAFGLSGALFQAATRNQPAGRLVPGQLCDETARALGGNPGRARTLAVVPAIVLSAGAVTAAGPVAFIALTAP